MNYICNQKGSNKATYKKTLNKMKNLNLILFFAIVTILVTGVHFLTLSCYR